MWCGRRSRTSMRTALWWNRANRTESNWRNSFSMFFRSATIGEVFRIFLFGFLCSVNTVLVEQLAFWLSFVLSFRRAFAVLDVLREEEFSPVKNNDLEPKDTPTTARHAIYRLHKSYIERAGGSLVERLVVGSNSCDFFVLLFESFDSGQSSG